MSKVLEKNYSSMDKNVAFFQNHLQQWLPKNFGKFVVITNEKLFGTYDTYPLAYKAISKIAPVGSYIIEECIDNGTKEFISHYSILPVFLTSNS
jgi:hypothetical protein